MLPILVNATHAGAVRHIHSADMLTLAVAVGIVLIWAAVTLATRGK